MKNHSAPRSRLGRFITISSLAVLVCVVVVFTIGTCRVLGQGTEAAPVKKEVVLSTGIAFLGIGLAVGLACIGGGIATGYIGAAAMGAISEKPEMFGRAIILIGLAEGIAIYGVVMGIIMFQRL